jgi:hypothetical protein
LTYLDHYIAQYEIKFMMAAVAAILVEGQIDLPLATFFNQSNLQPETSL